MELKEEQSFEDSGVPKKKVLKDCWNFNEDDWCDESAVYSDNERPKSDQIQVDTNNRQGIDTDPDKEVDKAGGTFSATLLSSSIIQQEGGKVKNEVLSSTNVSHLSTRKASPTPDKNGLKIKIKHGKIVQNCIDGEKVEKAIEGSELSPPTGISIGSARQVESKWDINEIKSNTTSVDSTLEASAESKNYSLSKNWNIPLLDALNVTQACEKYSQDASNDWSRKTDESSGMPSLSCLQQDSTDVDPLAIDGGETLTYLNGPSFQLKNNSKIKSNISKTKNSEIKRKPSKGTTSQTSNKRLKNKSKRKSSKSLSFKLRRTMLIVRRTCRKCMKKSSTFDMNKDHEKLEHPHICQVCSDGLFSFINKNDLKQHQEEMHSKHSSEAPSQRTQDSESVEKGHNAKNVDDDIARVAKMPKLSERQSITQRLPLIKEENINMVPLKKSNENTTGNTFNQIVQDKLSNNQTDQEKNFTLEPKKEIDFNKNKTLPDNETLTTTQVNNLIKTATYLVTKPTFHENGTSWMMEQIDECADSPSAHNYDHSKANKMRYEVPVSLPEGAVLIGGSNETNFNMYSDSYQTPTANLTGSVPGIRSIASSTETSRSIKVEACSSTASPGAVTTGKMRDKMIRPAMGVRGGVNMPNLMIGGNRGVSRGNRPIMGGRGGVPISNLTIGGNSGVLHRNLNAKMIRAPLRGSAVPLVRGMRPRGQMGRGVNGFGMQGLWPFCINGAPRGPLGVRGSLHRLSNGTGALHRPQNEPGVLRRPQLWKGRGGMGMRGVPGRTTQTTLGPRVPKTGNPNQIPTQNISIRPMVPADSSNLSSTFQPKIIKVETISVINLSDEESPSNDSVNSVLKRLETSGNISITRNKTPSIPTNIPPGISVLPASISSKTWKNGVSFGEVEGNSVSITPLPKKLPDGQP